VVFNNVVVKSTASRKVHLHNFGDLGSKFRFEIPPSVQDLVSITPSEGFVNKMNDEILIVHFHPRTFNQGRGRFGKDPNAYVIDNIRCILENHPPVPLTVTGNVTEQPPDATKQLTFAAVVREEQVQSIEVKNDTDQLWKIRPNVLTEKPAGSKYWRTPDELDIPSLQTASLPVTYHPLSTATEDNPHRGQIFLATPDGRAFMYELQGTATGQSTPKTITQQVKCKQRFQVAVPIPNWLNVRQRFQVDCKLVEPAEGSPDAAAIKLHALPDFDLPGSLERSYKFSVYAYKVLPAAKVSLDFRNVDTDESYLVDVNLSFTEADALGSIRFDTSCRQQVMHPLQMENPLTGPATFTCSSDVPDVTFRVGGSVVESFTIPAKGDKPVDVLFKPLVDTEGQYKKGTVTLSNPELGKFEYTVDYRVGAPGLERTILCKAPLGQSVEQSFEIKHFSNKPATYKAQIVVAPGRSEKEKISFELVKPEVKADKQGDKVEIPIRFTPASTSESRAMLSITSEAGSYQALLTGFVQPPQPAGPFKCAGGKAVVPFTNPFPNAVDFKFQVDNPAFELATKEAKIEPFSVTKKAYDIQVTYVAGKGPPGGRILASCHGVPTPWVFFLEAG
jgi:hydrocephalus-inducing protein